MSHSPTTRVGWLTAMTALVVGLMPAPAHAHVQVERTFPRAGGSACTSIGRSYVDFNGSIHGGSLQVVRRSDGVNVSRGDGEESENDSSKLVVRLHRSRLQPGRYRAHWNIVAANDGDTQEGTFRFRLRDC